MTNKPKKKITYSWSRIEKYMMCAEQFRRIYVLKDRRPAGVNAARGRGVHKSIEQNMMLKMTTGEMLTPTECAEVASEEVYQHFRHNEVFFTPEQRQLRRSRVISETIHQAHRLASLHAINIAPNVDPWRIEHHWTMNVDDHDFALQGYVDLQEKPPEGRKTGMIHDTKTTAKSPPKKAAEESDQLTLYALWSYLEDGEIPPLQMDFLVNLKKAPKSVILNTTRTATQLNTMLQRLLAAIDGITKGCFPPAPRSQWICSETYCAYYRDCRYTKGW